MFKVRVTALAGGILMFDNVLFELLLSTWTWDTFPMLRGTWGLYLNPLIPPRPSKSWG